MDDWLRIKPWYTFSEARFGADWQAAAVRHRAEDRVVIVRVREKYGARLAFYGGIDKHVLRRAREEIAHELEYKIPPMVRSGGCVLALDHRIPNGTPLAHYRFYVARAWEIMHREASRGP
jgi:uroporphyrinogen-III decarboxylase